MSLREASATNQSQPILSLRGPFCHCERSEAISNLPCLCERSEAIAANGRREETKYSPKALAATPPRLPRHSVPRNDIGWWPTEIARALRASQRHWLVVYRDCRGTSCLATTQEVTLLNLNLSFCIFVFNFYISKRIRI